MNAPLKNFMLLAAIGLSIGGELVMARDVAPSAIPAHGVVGVESAQLDADYWIARLTQADAIILDKDAIAAQNARVLHEDPSMHDLAALPAELAREQVLGWIDGLSTRPARPLFDVGGNHVSESTLDALMQNVDRGAVPAVQARRDGLVVRRAALRTLPTSLRVFSTAGDTDIDRFQESALFPGTAVVIVHASRDGQWLFVVSARYAAWIEATAVAEGSAAQVAAYATHAPYRIVTGATAQTVFTPEQPAVSRLQLDMGLRVPVLADWPADKPVNGQHSYTAHVLELPIRKADGRLGLVPALLQGNADSRTDYLPLNEANIVHQAFKFLGERYGWGHSYEARDCSGFVSEVYQSMGVLMPRNTRDQSISPALHKRLFTDSDDHATRVAAALALQPGDLVYIPAHVMMVIGNIDGRPYVIHDTTGLSYRQDDGSLRRITLNGVSVSPLLPLLFNEKETYIDRMTSIVSMRPAQSKDIRPVP